MPTLISESLGSTHSEFIHAGIFDGFVDLDSQLHVDPHLLPESGESEFVEAYQTLLRHFVNVLKVVRRSSDPKDAFAKTAANMLTFPELAGVGLGYSRHRANGNAIGKQIAQRLVQTAHKIIAAGVEDPVIFELVGLLEDDIGPDRLSDMVLHITKHHLAAYTARVSLQLHLTTASFSIEGQQYLLPFHPETRRRILLLPQDVLRDLPTSHWWDAAEEITAYSAIVRKSFNRLIGETWRQATSASVPKAGRLDLLTQYPDLLRELIARYRNKPAVPYDFTDDPAAEQRRYFEAVDFALSHPLTIAASPLLTPNDGLQVVLRICKHFKRLIEDNGLNTLLFSNGVPLRERVVQRVFFGIADAYCTANNLDLSAESNGGRGPIDFKISRGLEKVTVETKLSTHKRLLHGWSKQLPIYNAAEKTKWSVYLLVRISEKSSNIEAVKQSRAAAVRAGERCPELIIVDGRLKPSASK